MNSRLAASAAHRGLVAVASLVLLVDVAPARADDALAVYRTLPGSAEARQLLAVTRRAMDVTNDVAPASLGLAPPPALYVTLVGDHGIRACVGEDPPRGGDLADAAVALASQVRTGDRRRPPVRADELANLRLVIALAGPAEPVANPHEVDPGREGLLIEGARGRVAFLPGEARTVSWALREARRIGVIDGPVSAARYSRFEAIILHEPAPAAAHSEASDAAP